MRDNLTSLVTEEERPVTTQPLRTRVKEFKLVKRKTKRFAIKTRFSWEETQEHFNK
jgi:hypothetical protein